MSAEIASIVLASEAALALYPILIKTVPADLFTQILSRFITFTAVSAGLASYGELMSLFKNLPYSLGMSALNFTHIGSSYYAYQQLPAGIAQSLFYTYPILILLGGVFVFGDSITAFEIALISLAFFGVVLVSLGNKSTDEESKDPYNWKGLLSIAIAAITEAAIFFLVKYDKSKPSPFLSILQLYAAGLVGLLGYIGFSQMKVDLRGSVWGPMILFNLLVGFLGFYLRFYAIPKVSSSVFSLLSFVGVVAAFVWGYLFVNEIPTALSTSGAGLIATAVTLSRI